MDEERRGGLRIANARVGVDRYDIFGYLLPGIITTTGLLIWLVYLNGKSIQCLIAYLEGASSTILVIGSLAFIIVCYIIGQITAAFSMILFERIIVCKIFGYPYRILIFDDHSHQKDSIANFYRSIVFLFYIGIGAYISRRLFGHDAVIVSLIIGAIFIILTLLHVIERSIKPEVGDVASIRNKIHKTLDFILKWVTLFFAFFYKGGESSIKTIMDLDRPLTKQVRQLIIKQVNEIYGIDVESKKEDPIGTEIYWLIYFRSIETLPIMRAYTYKWFILSGLHRNVGGALIMAAIFVSLPAISEENSVFFSYISLCLFASSMIMSVRYYFIYYNYFSKSVFRSFVANHVSLQKPDETGPSVEKQHI